MKLNHTLAVAILAVGGAALYSALTTDRSAPEEFPLSLPIEEERDSTIASESFRMLLDNDDDASFTLLADDDFRRSASRQGPPYRVELSTSVVNPVTGGRESWERSFSCSFRPHGFSGITGNEFIVVGHARGGVPVFEYWTFPTDPGTYYSYRDLPGTPVGTPVPIGETIVAVAGSYTSPSKRDNLMPIMERTEIYRGWGADMVDLAVVDPEGRFVYSISNDTHLLYRVHIIDSSTPELVYNSSQVLALNGAVLFDALRHETKGIGWRIMSAEHVSILWDADNDGVTDTIENLTPSQASADYPLGSLEFP